MMTLIRAGVLVILLSSAVDAAMGLGPRRPSDVITLRAGSTSAPAVCAGGHTRFAEAITADGTLAPFTGIPSGQVLVITGFDWTMNAPFPNTTYFNAIWVEQPTGEGSPIITDSALSDGAGVAGHSTVTAPVVVKSGTQVCAGGTGLPITYLHGFFARDR